VGDDVWGEDPTVRHLEELSAELTGKEAGLFVTSGTQGNLAGILSHTSLGDEIIVGDRSHVFSYEVAGTAVVGGLQMNALPNRDRGTLEVQEVRAAIRSDDIHDPRTGCLILENTHNRCGGAVLNVQQMRGPAEVAHAHGIPVHLDGARLFNAAVALGVPVTRITEHVDSVTFCLSKGLGAPVGSVLCGPAGYIARARRWRKLLGGGMRQVGVLAAAGLVALTENVDRLAEDHANARLLAEGLAEIEGIEIDPSRVDSNMVFFDVSRAGPAVELTTELAARGVRLDAVGQSTVRAVTSYEVTSADIRYALDTIAELAASNAPLTPATA
jgi:threonine aldolase